MRPTQNAAPATPAEVIAAEREFAADGQQPATDGASRQAELARRAPVIAFSQLGGRASRAGDLVYTYGDATWTSGRGHYVRIWQKRAEGWKLVFDELLVVPPPKLAATP